MMGIMLWVLLGLVFIVSVIGLVYIDHLDQVEKVPPTNGHRRGARAATMLRPERSNGRHRT